MGEFQFQFVKFSKTVRGVFMLGMARTFGCYVHSIGGPNMPETAIYEWRGKRWHIALHPEEPAK